MYKTIEEFYPLFDQDNPHYHSRWLAWYGGRASMKSWNVAAGLLIRGSRSKKRILCAREYQNSIADSVLELLEGQAERIGLHKFYEFQRDAIYGINGTEFLFKGLHKNINSIRSIEDVDLCWVEEAQTVSEASWKVLTPTVRKDGSQILCTFNPDQQTDPTYQRLVIAPPKNSYVCKVNYDRNPWLSKEILDEASWMQRTDPDGYAHVWLGECATRSAAQIFSGKWRVDRFEEPQEGDVTFYYGADWGFSQDPTVLIRCFIRDSILYISDEIFRIGLEIRDIANTFKTMKGAAQSVIRADSARPETISHVKRDGLRVEAVEKWKGSVADGIAVLRGFDQIVIHERCKHMIQEARLYSYKVDRLTNDVLPEIIDKNNHGWDAVRYALAPFIKQKGKAEVYII